MAKIVKTGGHCKARTQFQQSSLFDHAEHVRFRALPLAARRLAQRFGLSAAAAFENALAAGFRLGGDK